MLLENPARTALLVAAVIFGSSASYAVAFAGSFDKPLQKKVVNLGRSPYLSPNSPSRIQLFCAYNAEFMVKELDNPGLKGTRWVTITPVANKEDLPPCRLAHASTERFMAKEWWSFLGIKGSLLFLVAADGDGNGGMPFRILDLKTGNKIFEDSAWWNDHLEFVTASDGTVSLKYLRVVGDDCSIPRDGASCWSKFRKHYGLMQAAAPHCTGYRLEGDKQSVLGDEGDDIGTPSSIAYPVEVKLFPRPTIIPVLGPLKCRSIP